MSSLPQHPVLHHITAYFFAPVQFGWSAFWRLY